MLTEQTIDKLLEMRLKSMVGALREQQAQRHGGLT